MLKLISALMIGKPVATVAVSVLVVEELILHAAAELTSFHQRRKSA